MYTSLSTTKRPAAEVLDEYLAALRLTDAYRQAPLNVVASVIVERMTEDTIWTPPRYEWDSRQPQNFPNGDRIWGSSYKGVYEVCFATNSGLEWQDYNVHHTIDPDGRGSVWLGVCNNSARIDISDEADALACWHARFALQN